MSNLKVLIVEDEYDGRYVVNRLLSANGLESESFADAESALDALRREPDSFCAAVIDLALPGIDGFEMMQVIRSEAATQHLPLVAITAFHTPELRVRALEGGFNAYFEKPLDQSRFPKAVVALSKG